MDSIYRGGLDTPGGRWRAWIDSLFIDHGLLRLVWSNAGVVVAGRLYRCNHPPPWRLAAMARRWGLRSVVNLRGTTGNGSDALSRERAGALGLAFFDVPMASSRAPSRTLLLTLIAAFAAMREPGLLHCKSGADRTGFAAAVFLLLQGQSVAEARRQLSLRWGHLARSRAGVLDAVLEAYAREGEGRQDFAAWVRDTYDAEGVDARFVGSRFGHLLQDRLLRRE
jgi:protein tyrosine phosphatase (PTP) superfamily phosphohydrolase (DUF442 family)